MNYDEYSINGILLLHGAIRSALGVDDNTPKGVEKPYGVREFSDWRLQVQALESALKAKGAQFEPIRF
jgi:hypothetical protein